MQEITERETELAAQVFSSGNLVQGQKEEDNLVQKEIVVSDLAKEEMSVEKLEAENTAMRASFTPLYTKIGQNFYEKTEGYEFAITAAVKELAE